MNTLIELLLAVLVSQQAIVVNSLRCRYCLNVQDPSACQRTTTCYNNQLCFVETVIGFGFLAPSYNLGCIDTNRCHGSTYTYVYAFAGSGGRRQVDHESPKTRQLVGPCFKCCDTENCNHVKCEALQYHDPCASSPCQHGGKCVANSANSYVCHCSPGFSGTNCQTVPAQGHTLHCHHCKDITHPQDCTNSIPCQPGELCSVSEKKSNSGQTLYSMGCFSKLYCPSSTQAAPGRRRHDFENSQWKRQFQQAAPDCLKCCGTDNCNQMECREHHRCASNPCQNGGTCRHYDGKDVCHCPTTYTGAHCETFNPCATAPCQNGGSCKISADTYTCSCPTGFTGQQCEKVQPTTHVDPCDIAPCQNGGSCKSSPTGVSCNCPPGFTGLFCGDDIDECSSYHPCQNGGSCKNTAGGFLCHCPTQFRGNYCDQDVDECLASQCQNGGTCINSIGGFHCQCPFKFSGAFCEHELNGTICHDCKDIDNPENCMQRKMCEETQECYAIQTTDLATGQVKYTLGCAAKQVCVLNPATLMSGRRQQSDTLTTCFRCCGSDHCSQSICVTPVQPPTATEPCATTPCQNGGSCRSLSNSYTCLCSKGFTGLDCETDIDECVNHQCLNGGTCVNTPGGYHCQCSVKFEGTMCEHELNGTICHACDNIADPTQCTTAKLCDETQECYAKQVTNLLTGQVTYTLGCALKQVCGLLQSTTGTGKRQQSDFLNTCFRCCEDHYCSRSVCVKPAETKPVITKISPDLTAASGSSVTFTCSATGSPEPKIQWGHLDMYGFPESVDLLPNVTVSGPTITFDAVTSAHDGTYVCRAINNVGSDSKQVVLTVQ